MNLITRLASVILLFTAAGAIHAEVIPADTAVRHGTLPNGLTYYVRHNNYPAGHADFFIAQRVGSMQEQENQRGLAHFLEHMCFNGTKHFPGNSLIDYMESIGVKFGANLNAYTSTDETVYNISDVPTTRRSALDSCMLALADWSHNLLLNGKDIDEERGVIEGEYRHRSGANYRLLEKASPIVYGDNLYARRMPIGLMSVVKNFKHKHLRDYYRKWYHPGNQCIIVVGDIDPDWAVAKIHELFAKVKQPKNAAPVVKTPVPDNEQILAAVLTDPEQPSTSVRLLFKHDDLPESQQHTTAWFRHQYLNYLVTHILAERFADFKQQPDAPFTHVGVADRKFLLSSTRQALQFTALSKAGQAEKTMEVIAREVNRATTFGFTDTELRRARLSYTAALDRLYRERNKYPNTRLARDFVRAYLEGEPIPSLEDNDRINREVIDATTLNDVNAHLRKLVSPTDRNVVLLTFAPDKETDNLPTQQQLINAFHNGRQAHVEAYVDTIKSKQLLPQLPTPGTIVSEQPAPAFNASIWTLSNGIKVWVKHTDISPDETVIAGAGPGGLSQNYNGPQDAPTFKVFSALAATLGFGQFSGSELKKQLAGKDLRMRTFISKTEEGFQGAATRADLETAFQLLYLKLTSPQPDQQAFDAYVQNQRSSLDNRAADPKFEFADSIFANVYNHHPLGGERLNADELNQVSLKRVAEVYADRFADMSDFTVYLIGDFNTDTLRTLVCRYLASLPANGRVETPQDINYRLFSGKHDVQWTRKMENPQDKVYCFRTSTCPYNLKNHVTARLTSQLLKGIFREEIREKRSLTYHVDTHCSITTNLNGNDDPCIFMPLNVTVTAGHARETHLIIEQVFNDVAKNGVPQAELDKAKQYLVKVYREGLDDNTYWMDMMRRYVRFGIDFHTDYLNTINEITPDDIARFVATYINTPNRLTLTMTAQ